MRNVCPVKALSSGDKELGNQEFFGAQHMGSYAMYDRRSGSGDPGVLHYDSSVAHAGDEIHVERIPMRLIKPDRITDLALEPFLSKPLKS
jgi:hypothetical protein